jgi:hypothetical protein
MARGGAIVGGRNTYEAADSWGGSIPFGIPFFIVTHNLEDAPPDDGFTFVNGLDEALARAREAAGDKDVFVMGERERDRRCENRTETRRHRPNGDLDRQRDHAGLRPLLPLTLTMNDLFRRDKLAHLPKAITTEGKRMSPIASSPS